MLTLKPFFRRIMVGRWCGFTLPPRLRAFTFISRSGFDSLTLAHMLDSLVRVSRRVDEMHFVSLFPSHDKTEIFFPRIENNETGICCVQRKQRPTASHRFLFSNFRYCFTLFSKFFSSFPHGTCLLSVSYPYLALDGIYHPIRAAIPNNSTHGRVERTRP
jgi:hypothetical protein